MSGDTSSGVVRCTFEYGANSSDIVNKILFATVNWLMSRTNACLSVMRTTNGGLTYEFNIHYSNETNFMFRVTLTVWVYTGLYSFSCRVWGYKFRGMLFRGWFRVFKWGNIWWQLSPPPNYADMWLWPCFGDVISPLLVYKINNRIQSSIMFCKLFCELYNVNYS